MNTRPNGWVDPATYELPEDWEPTTRQPVPPRQCQARRQDGEQCGRWAIQGTGLTPGTRAVCFRHGGALPQVRKMADARVLAVRMQIMDDTDMAVQVLEDLMQPGTSEGVRLKAATEVLDRAGLKPGMELNVSIENNASPLDAINEKLSIMAAREGIKLEDEEDIIDVTEEPQDSTEV